MANLRNRSSRFLKNRIAVKLVSNPKNYLKLTSKPSYTAHKIFGMCLLELNKALMYGFHYAYIKKI